MQDPKMSSAKDQTSSAEVHREPYEPPTVTVVPLKIEERLLACSKQNRNKPDCSPAKAS